MVFSSTGELYDVYCSQNIIQVTKSRRIRLAGHFARTGGGERRGAYKVLVGKPEGKKSLGRAKRSGRIMLY
jgi:hypothetical protein